MNIESVCGNPYLCAFQRVDINVVKDLKKLLESIDYYSLNSDMRQVYKNFLDDLTIEVEASEP